MRLQLMDGRAGEIYLDGLSALMTIEEEGGLYEETMAVEREIESVKQSTKKRRVRKMKQSIFALLGGTIYLNFQSVPYMIKAGMDAIKGKVSSLPKYRVYLDSGSNIRNWHDNVACKDPNLAGRLLPFTYRVDPQLGTRTFQNREECNRQFVLGLNDKAPATGIITLGPLAGHFDFENRNGERIQRASTGESLVYWNWPLIREAKVPFVQVMSDGEGFKAHTVTDGQFFFSAGREVKLRKPEKFEQKGTVHTGL